MRTLPDRHPSFNRIALSFTRGALLGGGCIFGLVILMALTLSCLTIQRDYGLGILFDDLGGRMVIGAMVGGTAGIAASCVYSRLSKPIRILSLSLLLAYALSLACSPLYQQKMAMQMMAAIDHKDIGTVKSLLNRGFDINRIYWTLQRNADYDNPNMDCECSEFRDELETALIHAVKRGDRVIVALLLQRGADVNEQNEDYMVTEDLEEDRYALSAAAVGGDSAMVTLLLDHGANVASASSGFALSIAAKAGHTNIVQILIQHGADVQSKTTWYGNTPLYYTAESGNSACARLLLEHGADVNAVNRNGETALSRAAYCQADASFVSLLLDHKADITITDLWSSYNHENVLTSAAKANHLAIARLLHTRGLPLHVFEAASLNDAKTLDRLILNGEKLEQKDSQGMTPLLNAVQANNVQAVRLLLSRGADIHATDTANRSVLWLINLPNTSDPTEMIDTLIASGIDINANPEGVETALIHYVRCGNIQAVKALLKHHPDLMLQDNDKKTALMVAQDSHEGNQEIADLLVKAGAKK